MSKATHMEEKIIHLSETVSTNAYLKQLLNKEEGDSKIVVVTEFQTAGKGQRGNSWESEKGKNLTFSFNIKPLFLPVNKQFMISKIVSIALQGVIANYIDQRIIKIKWPNDIYVDNHKIAGILIEHAIMGSYIEDSIIGIGLNVNQELFLSDAPNPISLKLILKKRVDRELLLQQFLKSFNSLYRELKEGNWDLINESYLARLYRHREEYLFEDRWGVFKGLIENVNEEGVITIVKVDHSSSCNYLFKQVKYLI